nr:MASE1 domain-containing protein [Methylomirabilota bacterium]
MPQSGPTRWAWLAALTVVYIVAGKIGLLFTSVHASTSPVWPPTGIALASLLLFGPWVWPSVTIGAFLVNLTTAGSVATSLGIAAGNTLEAVMIARFVEEFAAGRHAFDRPRSAFVFAAAVVPGAVVSASVGVSSLVLGGYASPSALPPMWTTWVFGDVASALIVTPSLLLWATDRRVRPLLERPLELGAAFLALILLGAAAFGTFSPPALRHYPLAFVSIPPLLWIALRSERRAAALAVLLLSGIALRGTVHGHGPFSDLDPTHSLLVAQAFTATMALMTFVVAALAWSRERESALLQTIIDRIPIMITMYQPNTRILRLNHEFERLTGWSTAEARQVDLMARCYPDPAYREEVRAFMDALGTGWRDITMTTKSGERIDTSWSNVRLGDDTRIGIGLDVRERKHAEAERARAHAETEAANRAKDEFFAMLGHELRNPLGAITAALHVIDLCGPGDERSAQARAIVARQVRHLVRLVDDLLDVTRLTTGKIALTLRPVDLTVVTRRAVAALAATAPGRRVECRAAQAAWIAADETRLEQILTNLLGNAVKFTPASGVVSVSVNAEDGQAVLRVADTGAGIHPDLLPRIFDLFVQGHTGLHRREAGLGIGLTLTRRLVDLHNGRIQASSDGPGRGSVFTVRFPAIEAPPEAPEPPSLVGPRGTRRRVLIVEDHDDARQMLRHLLESLGHEVHEAADGISGLDHALRLSPDAVVVDIGLPGLDGYAVARELRHAGRPGTLLIAVTGYGQEGDRQRSAEAGFDAHLTKPIDPRALDVLLGNQPLDRDRTGR